MATNCWTMWYVRTCESAPATSQLQLASAGFSGRLLYILAMVWKRVSRWVPVHWLEVLTKRIHKNSSSYGKTEQDKDTSRCPEQTREGTFCQFMFLGKAALKEQGVARVRIGELEARGWCCWCPFITKYSQSDWMTCCAAMFHCTWVRSFAHSILSQWKHWNMFFQEAMNIEAMKYRAKEKERDQLLEKQNAMRNEIKAGPGYSVTACPANWNVMTKRANLNSSHCRLVNVPVSV